MDPHDDGQPALLKPAEVAKRMRITTRTLGRWVHAGKLPALQLPNGELRFRAEDIDAALQPFVPEQRSPGASAAARGAA